MMHGPLNIILKWAFNMEDLPESSDLCGSGKGLKGIISFFFLYSKKKTSPCLVVDSKFNDIVVE